MMIHMDNATNTAPALPVRRLSQCIYD